MHFGWFGGTVLVLNSMRPGNGVPGLDCPNDGSPMMDQPITYVKVGDEPPTFGKVSSGHPSRVAKHHIPRSLRSTSRPVGREARTAVGSDNGRPRRNDPLKRAHGDRLSHTARTVTRQRGPCARLTILPPAGIEVLSA